MTWTFKVRQLEDSEEISNGHNDRNHIYFYRGHLQQTTYLILARSKNESIQNPKENKDWKSEINRPGNLRP